jgi:hypothetical protein
MSLLKHPANSVSAFRSIENLWEGFDPPSSDDQTGHDDPGRTEFALDSPRDLLWKVGSSWSSRKSRLAALSNGIRRMPFAARSCFILASS